MVKKEKRKMNTLKDFGDQIRADARKVEEEGVGIVEYEDGTTEALAKTKLKPEDIWAVKPKVDQKKMEWEDSYLIEREGGYGEDTPQLEGYLKR
jgi:hypothetical protein